MPARHRFEEHTSEVLLRVYADTLPELYAEAGRALSELVVGAEGVEVSEPLCPYEVTTLSAPDREALLVEWLNELVYRADTRGRKYVDFEVEALTDQTLRMGMRGIEPPALRNPVKAATYHQLKVASSPHGYQATVVLDV